MSQLAVGGAAYRYTLRRSFEAGRGICAFVMLNPSTADDTHDDPTIRRCSGFARSWGFRELIVVNLFALRATHPRNLRCAADPVGPDNDAHIESAIGECGLLVAAWGAHPAAGQEGRADAVRGFAERHGTRIHCLDVTMHGHPRHPLYAPGDSRPSPYPADRAPHPSA